ncbi:hypothetical protein [Halorubrum sodomense]|uniref:hypothetical protein n=1 Tax=Halorubrum sodomense TaxID=35743 RepID=UPI001160C952|nr:hypothetical protein [Halorubrum sodomense]
MPIERDSGDWRTGDESPTAESIVVDFLSNHPNKAYNLRELANELGVADWDKAKKVSEDQMRMEKSEFDKKYPVEDNHPTPNSEIDATRQFYTMIRPLAQMDIIDIRKVDADAFDDEYILPDEDLDTITTVAYTADEHSLTV